MLKLILKYISLAIGFFKKDIFFVSWNRIAVLIFLFSFVLLFNAYSVTMFHAGGVHLCLFTFFSANFYGSSSSDDPSFIPVKSYTNADTMKLQIFSENKGKTGIYRWVNNVNGKSYIGSALDLNKRLRYYYSYSHLISHKNKNMLINKALLKYGYSRFSLEVLEYCDKEQLILREQFYIDNIKPEYNLSPTAGSSLGLKRSEETPRGQKLSLAMKGKSHFEISKLKISDSQKGENNHMFGKTHSEETKNKLSRINGTSIFVYNLQAEFVDSFTSIKKAANHFKASQATIVKYALSEKIFRSQYILSFTNKTNE
jgi:group I intron endonuclease